MIASVRRARVVWIAALATLAATVTFASVVLDLAGLEPSKVVITIGEESPSRIPSRIEKRIQRVGFLGDSTVVGSGIEVSLPIQLRRVLNRRSKRPIRVMNLAAPGMSSFGFFTLLDDVLKSRPDLVIVPINLASFAPSWRSDWDRVNGVGRLSARQLADFLTRPYHAWGLTLDRILLYQAIRRLGVERGWKAHGANQVRAIRGVALARRSMARGPNVPTSGLPRTRSPLMAVNRFRFNPRFLREIYGPALTGITLDHPTAQMLEGVLAGYRDAGVGIIAYVVPMNIDHLARVGVEIGSGLEGSIATLRGIVEREGGEFIDLHAMLPDRGFRDPPGHFSQNETIDGPLLVAERLAPAVLAVPFPRRASASSRASNSGAD